MSFKEETKKELLSSLPASEPEAKAFLSAVARVAGSIELSRQRLNLVLRLETWEAGLQMTELIKRIYPIDVELKLEKAKGGKQTCEVRLPNGFSKHILADLELMSMDGDSLTGFIEGAPQQLIDSERCKEEYLRGLYLACGSIYVPSGEEKKAGYHFELSLDSDLYLDDVMEILSDLRINTRMSARGDRRLIYVKDSEEILSILAKMRLANSALKLKEIIDERQASNSLNRAVICDMANLDKTIAASTKCILAIQKLISENKFDDLPAPLKEAAMARMQNPKGTLNELAQELDVSKSCLNHRFRRLLEIASEE